MDINDKLNAERAIRVWALETIFRHAPPGDLPFKELLNLAAMMENFVLNGASPPPLFAHEDPDAQEDEHGN